jgi:hypothetical protein
MNFLIQNNSCLKKEPGTVMLLSSSSFFFKNPIDTYYENVEMAT